MATTRLIALHQRKGRSVAHSLGERTDYAKNPEKTEKGALVTAYGCDPITVDEEFLLQKRRYHQITGKTQKSDVIAYQIRQSFKPGEINPEEANRLGHELAMRFTKGRHSFIVATHTDKAHIHNHIVFNSTAMDGTRKFNNYWFSGIVLQRVSDLVCLENGLSVITPAPYSERTKRSDYLQKDCFRDVICKEIDNQLIKRPKDFSAFLDGLKSAGYEIKQGKHLAIKNSAQKRFIRFSSLGEGYTEAEIRAVIAGEKKHLNKGYCGRSAISGTRMLDLERILKEKGPGYQRWAKSYNLKQLSKSVLYLRDRKLSIENLHNMIDEKAAKRDKLLSSIKTSEARMAEIASLKKHIINYSKTHKTYEDYRKAGYSKRFFEAHREELALHKAAKAAFDELGVKKIPKVKDLSVEYSEILSKKKLEYSEYRKIRDETQELLIAEYNINSLFEAEEQTKKEYEKESHGPNSRKEKEH